MKWPEIEPSEKPRDSVEQANKVTIIYDGQCPICSSTTAHIVAKNKAPADVLDARSLTQEEVERFRSEGHDLSSGMIVRNSSATLYGAEAMLYLLNNSHSPILFYAGSAIKGWPPTVRATAYRVLVWGRNLVLILLGRSPAITGRPPPPSS